jgi:hypothetical protein
MPAAAILLERLTQILVEGRKEDALKRVVKGLKDPEVVSHVQSVFKSDILAQDPSGKQKYAMWAAGMINARLVKMQKNYDTGMQRDIDAAGNEIKYEATRRAGALRRSLGPYHRLAQKNLIEKNINTFKDFGEFEQKIYIANKELEEREAMARRKEKAKESSDIIGDEEDWMMVRPNDEDAACYYGQGTRWCISATDSENYFDQYASKGKVFYFLLFKHLNNDDPMKRIALVYDHRDAREGDADEPEEVFDAPDDEVGTSGLNDAIYANLVMKGYALGQENTKEFLKNFRSASGREEGKSFRSPDGIYASVLDFSDNVVKTFADWMDEYYRDTDVAIPESTMIAMRGLGLSDPQEEDVHEEFQIMVSDQYVDLIGSSLQHAQENKGGRSHDDYEEVIANAGLQYFSVMVDYYYEGDIANTVTAEGSIDLTNDDELGDISDRVFQDIVDDAATEHNIYPSDIQVDGARAYLAFNPDYDEGGWDGFNAFVSRISEYDSNYNDFHASVIQSLKDKGYYPGEETWLNLAKFEDMDLKNFEVDIEEGKVTMTTFLPIRLYLPPELLSRVKTAGRGEEGLSNREQSYIINMNTAILSGIKQENRTLRNKIVQQIQTTVDQALNLIAAQMPLNLTEAETGHPVPDHNIDVGFKNIRTAGTGIGGGSAEYRISDRIDVWMDVKLEPNQEPEALKIIEKFVKMMDDDKIHERLRRVAEAIVTNMIVKKIIPKFKKDHAYNEMRRQQQVAESSYSSFDDWKEILNEWRKYKK